MRWRRWGGTGRRKKLLWEGSHTLAHPCCKKKSSGAHTSRGSKVSLDLFQTLQTVSRTRSPWMWVGGQEVQRHPVNGLSDFMSRAFHAPNPCKHTWIAFWWFNLYQTLRQHLVPSPSVLSLASPASLVPGHVRRCLTSVWNGVSTASVLDFVRFRPVATVGQVKATDIRTRGGSDMQADLRL